VVVRNTKFISRIEKKVQMKHVFSMIKGPQLPVNVAPKVGRKRPMRFTSSYQKSQKIDIKYGRYEQSSSWDLQILTNVKIFDVRPKFLIFTNINTL